MAHLSLLILLVAVLVVLASVCFMLVRYRNPVSLACLQRQGQSMNACVCCTNAYRRLRQRRRMSSLLNAFVGKWRTFTSSGRAELALRRHIQTLLSRSQLEPGTRSDAVRVARLRAMNQMRSTSDRLSLN